MVKATNFVDEYFFCRENVIHLDAAMIGISRNNWQAIPEKRASPKAAIEIMRKYRFDVLPIVSGERVTGYFQTSRWNDYSPPVRKSLSYKDVIPLQTHVRDLIKSFAKDHRLFYFLSNENRIAGLVTVADLNSRLVKTYLYSLLCELEIGLGKLIAAHVVPQDKLLTMTLSGSKAGSYERAKKCFEKDRRNGVETSFIEYLYLPNIIDVIEMKCIYRELDYSKSEFTEGHRSLIPLRNKIAHPNKMLTSIINNVDTVDLLWSRVDLIEDALFRLRQQNKCGVNL